MGLLAGRNTLSAVLLALGLGTTAVQASPITTDLAGQPVTITGEARLRVEERWAADFFRPNQDNPKTNLIRMRVGIGWTVPTQWNMMQGWSVFLQPQYAYQDSTDARPLVAKVSDLNIHQGYVEGPGPGGQWRVGRQELAYGDRRLIGQGDWSNLGRSFDGIRVSLPGSHIKTDVFATQVSRSSARDGNPWLAGAYSVIHGGNGYSDDLYLLIKGANPAGKDQLVWTLGARPHFFFFGGGDGTVEAAYQFGNTGGRPLSAWAYAANLGYTLPTRMKLRLAVERDFASGGNPATGTVHTFDQLFPTNHAHYGIIDYVGWRNIQAWSVSARATPWKRWTLGVEGWAFALANAKDAWYSDNGRPMIGVTGAPLQDPNGISGTDLGREIDVTATYEAGKNITLSGGYSRFTPRIFVLNTNGRKDPSDWFYLQSTFKL